MPEEYAREMFQKALEAMKNEQEYLALSLFEKARIMSKDPLYLSSKALCVAKVRRSFKEAIYLCRDALDAEPANPVHYLHLGKILLLAGQKSKAIKAFRDGLKHGGNPEIIAELEKLGLRKTPVFKFLARKHPLNKISGLLLSRIGLR
jgi:predicted Zn-dependent protease